MRLSLLAAPQYQKAAASISSSSESPLDRLLTLGEECYINGHDKFYESHEESIPFITLEKTLNGIQALVSGRKGPFSIQETSKEYDWGYRVKEMDKPENCNNTAALEVYVSQWMDHVIFTWEDGMHFLSPERLRQDLNLPTIELYEFLAYVLRDCFRRDTQYRAWSSAQYVPALDTSQLQDFKSQVLSFRTETFSRWKAAYPILSEYLHPDLTPFDEHDRGTFASGLSDPLGDTDCMRLTEAFLAYSAQMERTNCIESKKERMSKMAEWFLSFRTSESSFSDVVDQPFFLDRPHLIFHIFRSPVHRYIDNYEDRHWDLRRTIADACVNHPLPITKQSLDADSKLFRAIIDICADRCSRNNIPFQKEAWDALWDCIVQCVQCLTFQSGDLFSMKSGFIHTLYLGNKGAPVSDRWIETRLTSESPTYVLIWRAFIKKWCNPSSKRDNQWQQALDTFRSLFEDVSVNSDEVSEHLEFLCGQIKWTGIPFLPPAEELADIDPTVSRRVHAAAIRDGNSAVQKPRKARAGETKEECIHRTESPVCTGF